MSLPLGRRAAAVCHIGASRPQRVAASPRLPVSPLLPMQSPHPSAPLSRAGSQGDALRGEAGGGGRSSWGSGEPPAGRAGIPGAGQTGRGGGRTGPRVLTGPSPPPGRPPAEPGGAPCSGEAVVSAAGSPGPLPWRYREPRPTTSIQKSFPKPVLAQSRPEPPSPCRVPLCPPQAVPGPGLPWGAPRGEVWGRRRCFRGGPGLGGALPGRACGLGREAAGWAGPRFIGAWK